MWSAEDDTNSEVFSDCDDWDAAGVSPFRRGDADGENCWSAVDARQFNVRSSTYLDNGVKSESEPAIAELVRAELFSHPEKLHNFCSNGDLLIDRLRARGDKRFYFVIVIIGPTNPSYHLCLYFAMPSDWNTGKGEYANIHSIWREFVKCKKSFCDDHFKVIPNIYEGNWVVKKAVGNTPTLLGHKLTQHYYHDAEKGYFELDIDVGSSAVASMLTQLLQNQSKALVIELGFVLEAKSEETLPERILGCVRLSRVNLEASPSFEALRARILASPIVSRTNSKEVAADKNKGKK